MFQPDEDGLYIQVMPSPARRILAIGAQFALGALLIWLAFSAPVTGIGTFVLLALGIAAIVFGERMRQATVNGIVVTTDGVSETSGEDIATWDQIASVERGTFAFKPSNGFALILHEPQPRRLRSGLWWCTGRRIGIGGVLPGREAKTMAEVIAFVLPQHENGAQ